MRGIKLLLMKCVLFDLDGTIADTETIKAKALSEAVGKFGKSVSPDIYKRLMGQSWDSVTSAFFQESQINVSLDQFNPVFRELYSRLVESELVESRGSATFLRFLKSKGILIGLVSSASPWMINKTLEKLQLDNLFDTIVSNADTERHKPYPDAYLIAMDRLQVKSSNTIAFEDSDSGFQSARAAGLDVFGVKHSYNIGHDFHGTAKTISSFESCLEWTFFRD